MPKKEYPTITLGHLREQLKPYPDNYEVIFSGLDFFRVKEKSPGLLQIEFNQQVYLDEQGNVVVHNLE